LPEEALVKVEVQAGRDEEETRAIERVVMAGDYGALSPKQRVIYVQMLCDRLGINWHTRPFLWIVLNGRLTLYATRNASDQIRATRNISITIVDRQRLEGDVFVVRALATTPDGRTDESLGAVSVAGLQGEPLANALMKAETKAKHRVTQSISGLSFLDETEVDSVRAVSKQAEGVRRIQPPPLAPGTGSGQVEFTSPAVDATVAPEVEKPVNLAPAVEPVEAKKPVKYPPASAPVRAKIT
jgi:hypothetical protein